MRYLLPALTLIAAPAFAGDFITQMQATDVTVYPQGAKITYTTTLDLPAGEHRVLMPFRFNAELLPRITAALGVKIVALNVLEDFAYDRDDILNQAQRAALQRVDDLEAALKAKQAELTAQQQIIAVLEMQNSFLGSISGAKLGDTDPDQLRAITRMIGEEANTLVDKKRSANANLARLQDAIIDLKSALSVAEVDFNTQTPFDKNIAPMLAVTVAMDRPVSAKFTVVNLENGMSWNTIYEFFLKTGDDPNLRLDRRIVVNSDMKWSLTDVALTLSTSAPLDLSEPSRVWPDVVSIYKTEPAVMSQAYAKDGAPAPVMMDPVVVLEEASSSLGDFGRIEGLSFEYVYPRRVTIRPDQPLLLEFGNFGLPIATRLLAIPRRDDTAFMMGEFTNDTGEPMLPGQATYYRDDVLVGGVDIEVIPAGGTQELPFGTMEGIRLDYKRLSKDTGDTGFFSVSNTRDEVSEFSVENLTGKPQDVRALFALPFSQQENLEISTRLRPNPDATDVDDKRGVAAWDLTLKAGEKKTVRITTQMSWPEGMGLNYRP